MCVCCFSFGFRLSSVPECIDRLPVVCLILGVNPLPYSENYTIPVPCGSPFAKANMWALLPCPFGEGYSKSLRALQPNLPALQEVVRNGVEANRLKPKPPDSQTRLSHVCLFLGVLVMVMGPPCKGCLPSLRGC